MLSWYISKHLEKRKNGFTLIELLVVIAIIGLLASIILVSINSARTKAKNVKRQADLKQISTAMSLFYQQNGRMPYNNNCGSNNICAGTGWFGACDQPAPETAGANSVTYNLNLGAYDMSMQELVDAGYMTKIPHSSSGPGYCYFDFGNGNTEFKGAIIATNLESTTPSTTGAPGGCRPWSSTNMTQWCEQRSSQEFCMCTPY